MTQDGMTKKIESLQAELQDNPRSLCFPLLADLYLQKNMTDEAYDLLQKGLHFHPHSVSGMIVLARLLKSRDQLNDAEILLSKSIQLAPQNWQAYLLRADLYVRKTDHKKALADFQKVLLFNPTQPVARKAVAKLQMLSEHQSDFTFQDIAQIPDDQKLMAAPQTPAVQISAKLERLLSLIDAFSMRQDYAKALKLLYECKAEFGEHPEIEDRLLQLSQHETAKKIRPKKDHQISESKKALIIEKKHQTLELLLRRIIKLQNERLVHN